MNKTLGLAVGLALITTSAQAQIFKTTGYCACVKCCGKSDGITASGAKAQPNHTVACNILPFGTVIEVSGKKFVVQDRGSKKYFGSKDKPIYAVDVFYKNHAQAKAHGVKYEDVIWKSEIK